jgi:hypothetical protein
MEEKVLTREEIALSVLNGILSSLYPTWLGAEGIVGDGSDQARDRKKDLHPGIPDGRPFHSEAQQAGVRFRSAIMDGSSVITLLFGTTR